MLLQFCITANFGNVLAVTQNYTGADNNSTVTVDPLPFDIINITGVTNLTFNGAINTNNNPSDYAILNSSSSVTFNKPVTSNNNLWGFYSSGTATNLFNVNASFSASNNGQSGLYLIDAGSTFHGDVTTSNNSAGVYLVPAGPTVFNGAVISNFNQGGIVNHVTSTGTVTFNGPVTTNNNSANGIILHNFNTYNNSVTANNNLAAGILINLSTNVFNGNITANANDIGIRMANNAAFNCNVTASGNTTADFYIQGAYTATFNNDTIIDAPITSSAHGNGNIIFTGAPTVAKQIGTVSSWVNKVEFNLVDPAKRRASLNSNIFANSIKLYGLTLGIDYPIVLYTPSMTVNDTIIDLNKNLVLTSAITDGTGNGVIFSGDGTASFNGNYTHNAAMLPLVDGKSNLVISGANTINNKIGDVNKRFDSVTINAPSSATRASLKNNIYANTINFGNFIAGIDQTIAVNGNVTTNNTVFNLINFLSINGNLTNTDPVGNITLTGNSALILNGDNLIDASIAPDNDLTKVISVMDAPIFNKSIGKNTKRFFRINFFLNDPNKRLSLNDDIYANTIQFGGAKVGIDDDLTMIGNVQLNNNTIFDLAKNLTLTNSIQGQNTYTATVRGAGDLIFNYSVVNAALEPETDLTGNVILKGNTLIVQPIGTISKNFALIKFIANDPTNFLTSIYKDLYAQKLEFSGLTAWIEKDLIFRMPVEIDNTIFQLNHNLDFNDALTNTDPNGKITIDGIGNLTFNNDNIIDTELVPADDGFGNVLFAGDVIFTGGPTVKQILGTPTFKLPRVKFTSNSASARASLNKDINTNILETGALQIGIDAALTFDMPITTNDTIFDLANDLTIKGPITDNTGNGVNITGSASLIFPSNYALNTLFAPKTDATGHVVFTDDPTINQPLGTVSNNFASVKFTSTDSNKRASLTKNIYTQALEFDELTVGIDADLTFRMPVTTKNTTFDLTHNLTINDTLSNIDPNGKITLSGTGNLTFNNDNVIDAAIMPNITESGNIIFTGGVTLNKPLGGLTHKLASVKFTPNSSNLRVSLNSDIYTKQNTIELGEMIVGIDKNITLGGNVVTDNTTFELAKNTLTLDGDLSHKNATGGVTIKTTYDGTNAGHFVITNNHSVDLSNSNQMSIYVTESVGTPVLNEGQTREINLFDRGGGNGILAFVDKSKIVVHSSSQYAPWKFDDTRGVLSQTLAMSNGEIIDDIVGGGGGNVTSEIIDNIVKNNPTLMGEMVNIALTEGAQAVKDLIEGLTSGKDQVALGLTGENLQIGGATRVVSNRVAGVNSMPKTLALDESGIGIAAGDDAYETGGQRKYGAWGSPFYGMNRQQPKKNTPGYRSKYYGGVIGFDSLLSEEIVLGLAVSAIKTNINHTDQNQGDKTKIDSYVVYGYGTYEFKDNWFVQNITSLGKSKIDNREIRKEFRRTSIARANYDVTFWSTEFLVGRDYKLKEFGKSKNSGKIGAEKISDGNNIIRKITDNMSIIPNIGIGYDRIGKIHYEERGTITQNLIVKCKELQHLEAILGLGISSSYNLKNGMIVTPELYGDVRYELINETTKVAITQPGIAGFSITPRGNKNERMMYSIGAGINIGKGNNREYSFDYDRRFNKKFTAHQGTFKFRLNF